MNKFIALVPMKAHSVRVKNKNIREIANKPLFYYILATLGRCRRISEIYINTDSEIIKEKINQDFKNVRIIDRPARLAGSDISMNEIIKYDLSQIEGDYFLQTHATNPLLKSETIDKAINFFLSQQRYDSLFSVTKMLRRYYDGKGKPINHDPNILLNTQDLNPLYEENSCVYLFTRRSFSVNNNRIGVSPYLYEIDKREALDIDDESDFDLVNGILNPFERIIAEK